MAHLKDLSQKVCAVCRLIIWQKFKWSCNQYTFVTIEGHYKTLMWYIGEEWKNCGADMDMGEVKP